MMVARAPAAVAFLAFCANPHTPRSTSAIRPATAAALVKGEQPSVEVPPVASTASTAATIGAATLGLPTAGPKAAVPNWYEPARLAGAGTPTVGLPNRSTAGTSPVTNEPVQTTWPKFVADASRCALVICGHIRPVVVSSSLLLK